MNIVLLASGKTMKQSSLVHSRIFRYVFFLLYFCILSVTPTDAQVFHRRLWPWPSQQWPFPVIQPEPWPYEPIAPGPSPIPDPSPLTPSGPSSAPGPPPCTPIPPKPQPNPPCTPPLPPCPSPKPIPPPCPSPPCPSPKPIPPPCPSPPCPSPKPIPPPCPLPPCPSPKPIPPPCPSPPCPSPQPIPPPCPKPIPPKPPVPPPKPMPPKPPGPAPRPPQPNPPKPHKRIPAVFFFGDSIFDTGNNNDRKTRVKSNYRPYGMDFKNGVATGRFSNGKVASDFIAQYLGVKEFVPAYLDKKLQQNSLEKSDFLTGVSFASAGAGYDPPTSKSLKAIPLMKQLTYFQDYKEKMKKLVGQKKTDEIVAKGIAFVNAGGNDLIDTYFGKGAQRLKNDIDTFTTIMADSAASFVLQLNGYGAKRIGVIGTPPLGCTPSQRRKRKCNENLNYSSQLFNAKLFIILGQLSKTLPNTTLVYMDIYSIFSQMLESPKDFGFENVNKPCCRPGFFGGKILCKKSTLRLCSNTSSYLFWDGAHPTQSAYEMLNKALVKEYLHALTH